MKILVNLFHANLEKSTVNRRWLKELESHSQITINQPYRQYPDGIINITKEQQLLSEFSVSVPPALLMVLRRRLTMAGDFGTLVLAPALAVAALVTSMHCGDVCTRPSPFVLPAAVAATVATLACAAAVVLTAGGRPARCIMPAGSSARAITTLPGFPPLPEVPAGARSPLARDRRRRGNVGSRRDAALVAL
jgi:hypothetical protein